MSMFERETKQGELLEAEIREFVQRDVAGGRTHAEKADALHAENVSSLLQRASANSVKEIEEIIARLEILRDRLRGDGARIQRRIQEYATLCQGAFKSTRLIAESLQQSTSVPRTSSVPDGAQLPHWLKSRNVENGAGERDSRAVPSPSASTDNSNRTNVG
jgi:hypothetical protein